MTGLGGYADKRSYSLPRGWELVPEELLDLAFRQTLAALTDAAPQRLTPYYDPASDFAGTTFLDASPNDPYDVTPADLWAVATLSMPANARQGRRLFHDDTTRAQVHRQLSRINADAALTDLDHVLVGDGDGADALEVMWDLYDTFRSLLSTNETTSNHWVFAAKLCARKRPNLFPVRDNLVCSYLSGGRPLGRQTGRLGSFHADIQTYAWLITHRDIRRRLEVLRDSLARQGVRCDEPPLKLLDAALWTCARTHGTGLRSGT